LDVGRLLANEMGLPRTSRRRSAKKAGGECYPSTAGESGHSLLTGQSALLVTEIDGIRAWEW